MRPAHDVALAATHDAITEVLLRKRRTVTAIVLALVSLAVLFVAVSLLLAVERPWTGLTMTRTGDGDAAQVLVHAVTRGSPADAAGLRVGDRVGAIAGVPADALVEGADGPATAMRDDLLSAIATWTQGQFDDDVTLLAIVRQP